MVDSFDKRQWQSEYRATCEMLETVRARELAALTDEDVLRIIQSLSVAEKPWRDREDWSGLVEQQAIFHRLAKS